MPERARERPTFAALVTEVHGTARLGRRTKHLVRRLTPEDIAVIDHADLDRMAAEDLVESGVKAVVNVSTSTSSRYPNPGPLILARAGIPLVDAVDAPLFEQLSDGDPVTVRGSTVIGPDGVLVEGRVLSVAELSNIAREQQHRIGEAIHDFAENTLEHIRDEGDILAGRLEIPELRTEFRDRHALIVVRGTDYRQRPASPAPVHPRPAPGAGGRGRRRRRAARGRADARPRDRRHGLRLGPGPDQRGGAGRARLSGRDRARGGSASKPSGSSTSCCPPRERARTSRCLSRSSAAPSLIVAVGTHFNLIEFLDKDREGMSSTFLTRLRVGDKLVDTKGVSRLYRSGPSRRLMFLLVLAALVTFVVIALSSPQIERLIDLLLLKLEVMLEGN